MIDRKNRFKAEPKNPLPPAHHSADDPDRAVGADGIAQARTGYATLDRANPRSPFESERRGVEGARQVFDGPNDDPEGGIIGRFVG